MNETTDREAKRDRVREIRLKLRLSQGEFAAKMGVNQKTWSNIEIGVNPCSDRYVNLVCLTYNVRKEWLLNGQGEIFAPQSPSPLPEPIFDDKGKPLPPEVADLITIYLELVPLNQKAVLDFMMTTLQSQRNTIKTLESESREPETLEKGTQSG
jgi:transcriptional regulator with XRE-family HTH domain